MLTLKEELFVMLHFSAKKGALVDLAPSTSELVAIGGILAELILAGRVRLDDNNLIVTDNSPLGDAILDEALAKLPPTQPVNLTKMEWILPVAKQLPVGHQVFGGLLEKGILHREEERKLFGLSRSNFYPVTPGIMQQLVERIRRVMVDGAKPDARTATLLFMASVWGTSGLEKLSGQEKKAYQQRWNALFGDYWGQYPADHEMEPIDGLDAATRETIGSVAVSWVSAQASYVAADHRLWRFILDAVDRIDSV